MPLGTEVDPFLGEGIIFLKWFTLIQLTLTCLEYEPLTNC